MAKRKVVLYGKARRLFGRLFEVDVRNPAEAVMALCCQLKGFEKFLKTAHLHGLSFAIFSGKRNLSEKEVSMDSEELADIRIVPIIMGSKSGGLFTAILGVVLIVAGIFTFGTTTAIGMGMIGAGAGLAMGGVAQMLAPSVKAQKEIEQDGNSASYIYNGAVTTTAAGSVVPYFFGGPLAIGGVIASAGIYSEDQL